MAKKLSILIVLIMLFPLVTIAEEPLKPIIIIRYNQQQLDYNRHLTKVIHKARSIKSEVNFKILSLIKSNDPTNYNKEKDSALQHAQEIFADISQAGINPERINVFYQDDPNILNNEVHIFAY